MLKLCDNYYATVYNDMFVRKLFVLNFGNDVIRNEAAFLNNQPPKWSEKVRHLGNIMDKYCTELADCFFIFFNWAEILPTLWCRSAVENLFYYCVFKKSRLIGYVNKL